MSFSSTTWELTPLFEIYSRKPSFCLCVLNSLPDLWSVVYFGNSNYANKSLIQKDLSVLLELLFWELTYFKASNGRIPKNECNTSCCYDKSHKYDILGYWGYWIDIKSLGNNPRKQAYSRLMLLRYNQRWKHF